MDKKLFIVTGISSNHFKALFQLLFCINKWEPDAKIIIYDLGLTADEKVIIKDHDIRFFDYSQYPEFFNIKINAGYYAWKPIIINQVVNECKNDELVLWLDAGNMIHNKLDTIKENIVSMGIFTPSMGNSIKELTYITCIKDMSVDSSILSLPMRNAAIIGIDTNNKDAVDIINKLKDSAYIENRICPKGHNRNTHRWDQSILSIYYYPYILSKNIKDNTSCHMITTHHDLDYILDCKFCSCKVTTNYKNIKSSSDSLEYGQCIRKLYGDCYDDHHSIHPTQYFL